jgi:hypothetical protein
MSSPSRLSPIPPFRRSPDARLPEFKALVIGNNSTSGPDELTGPVNDAKAVKEVLKGKPDNHSTTFPPLRHGMAVIAGVYHLREKDITLMTDEGKNRGTALWPSATNIVSFFSHTGIPGADNLLIAVARHR